MTPRMLIHALGALALVSAAALSGCHSESPAAASTTTPPTAPPPGVALPRDSAGKNPITTAAAKRIKLAADVHIVGSVSYDPNRYAVVGPLVAGRITKLRAAVGDRVRAGQVLAEVESAEVGQAQAAYLSARARAIAADANAKRERELADRRISSEREREVAEAQALSEQAERKAAIEKLRAFGLGDADLEQLDKGMSTGGRVPLRAPFGGTIIARTVTLGQAVERATDAFKLVDLDRLWVKLDVYEKDLSRVHAGQKVELTADSRPGEVLKARVAYVDPIIDEASRTGSVRVEVDNKEGKLRPGEFVTARLIGDAEAVAREVLAVPYKAVQTVEGKRVVFVRAASAGRFDKREIELGPSGGDLVEVRKGLVEGDEVATDGAFLLKSELLR